MNYILFDSKARNALLPFTFTKPVADIRVGILSLREKWEKHLTASTSTITEKYLEQKYPATYSEANILLNATIIPTKPLVKLVKNLKPKQALYKGGELIAYFTTDCQEVVNFSNYEKIEYKGQLVQIKNTWDIFSLNAQAINLDFNLLTEGRKSEPIPSTVNYINKDAIFIEKGADLNFATLNASTGPIYLGKNTLLMEGCLIRGGFALCEGSVVKMGSKIYGATTIGPYSKVGGEINNSVLFGCSNKGHEGYLGNSVLGEWCNLGADTNNSNLKNNYAQVRLWNYNTGKFDKTGLQFCGLIMGDHSKCGINTMFNTGTVVGVSANIFGSGFPRNFIPSFSWGGVSGFTEYKTEKVFEVVKLVMQRRGIDFAESEKNILNHIFEKTKKYRNY
ncbi:MAG: GlmU family protein [Tenacibaculum sp.]